MIAREATPADIALICADLRPADLAEAMAQRFDKRPEALAEDVARMLPAASFARVLADDAGAPVAFIGFWLIAPGLVSANLIATRRWYRISRDAHRYSRRFVMGRIAPLFRRLECRTLAGHRIARAWLRRLGFVEEGVLRRAGAGGEDFVLCAWVNPSFL